MVHNVKIQARYISTVSNGIADALSHFQGERFRQLTKHMDMNIYSVEIPEELRNMHKIWR